MYALFEQLESNRTLACLLVHRPSSQTHVLLRREPFALKGFNRDRKGRIFEERHAKQLVS